MFRNYIIVFCIVFLQLSSFGQQFTQTLRGSVTDKLTRLPLPGASVILLNVTPLKGAISDTNGRFRIEKVSIGRIGIKVSFIGYQDVILNELNLSTGKELVLNIEMEEKVLTSSTVVISGSEDKTQTINKMTTVSSRGFTVEETGKYAGSRSDVGRMAANFAGVATGNDARNDIVIRGNSPSGLLWKLEGVDIPNPNHFAAFGTTGGPICMIKNSMLSNSDFLTAAFPSEYGNAISGVFDLKMANGNNEKHEFSGEIGFNGLEIGAEGPVSRKNGSSYIINYRYSLLDFFSNFNIQFGTGGSVPRYQDLSFKINFPLTKAGSFAIFGLGGASSIALRDSKKNPDKIDFYGSEGWDIMNSSKTGVIGVSHTYIINKTSFCRSTVSATYQQFETQKDSVTPVTLALSPYQHSNYIEYHFAGSFYLNKKINSHHNFKLGFNLSEINYRLSDSTYYASDSAFRTITSYKGATLLIQPFVQWQYKINDRLMLNPGVHFQYLMYNQSWSLEPRIGLRWYLAPTQSVGFGYGMHSQSVPITVFFNQTRLSDGSYYRANDQLDFIRAHHVAINYDWNIREFFRLKAEVYYQYLYDVPVNANAQNSFSTLNLGANFDVVAPDSLVNKGKGYNYGIEITLERFLHKGWYLLVTGSLFDSKYKGSDGIERNTVFNGNYSANLLAGKEFRFKSKKNVKRLKLFEFDWKTTLSGGQRFTPVDIEKSIHQNKKVYADTRAFSLQFPAYNRTDIRVAYRMEGKRFTVEWALEIMNLFNQTNVFTQQYNRQSHDLYYSYQLGRTFMPSYKIIF
ncbi:MAG: TonB-dependent receptor [Bacteroidota bacterium]